MLLQNIASLDILATSVFLGGAILILSFALVSYMGLLSSRPSRREAYFAGKHVVITGGSSGIGKELAGILVGAGASVTLVARNMTRLQNAAKELAPPDESLATAARVNIASADCSDAKAVDKMVDDVESQFGPIDILVNSAGTAVGGYFEDLSPETFEFMMKANYFAQLYPTHAVFKRMTHRRAGQIVLISSMAGQIGIIGHSAYSPSKFAVRGLAEAVWYEGKPFGIGVTVAYPPDTDTPGYQSEKDTMPPETHEISNSSGVLTAEKVARGIADGMMRKQYRVSAGFNGRLLGIVSAGLNPGVGIGEVLSMPFLRALAPIFIWDHCRVTAKGHAVRFPNANKEAKPPKQV
ncbi:3-ketodihydrosphingosine reductase [Chondrus crispus]|uniref:3-dehydrosphinganine reductase n=1 Tax=Chondrus crispus TaxID=2769 RepID=R7Q3B5_CHOCR|nr:3-ketodihydrosphingosine reductase [Chondrus crispus]CDF32484.1 3-ketodihydrosphingosine reductase [Chondrus crispus]|eukprot:XP_005712149.1 3-ketodihydrosphingosine reductase [Chondrus crispus]